MEKVQCSALENVSKKELLSKSVYYDGQIRNLTPRVAGHARADFFFGKASSSSDDSATYCDGGALLASLPRRAEGARLRLTRVGYCPPLVLGGASSRTDSV
ncbi:hypothetical protein EVAR_41388_1 [Eumeta japonica]|uniref:Uncharacterized protein n=1 Tax=Eumeta variegata TaxID=151549 RepID=A0A4C1WZR7_EUMVA|nr:hypothetical protein EVAR_41388_1 [Eumeta japonica]